MSVRSLFISTFILYLCSPLIAWAEDAESLYHSERQSTEARFADTFIGSRPIAFTKNMGQWPDSILFRADIGSAVMWVVRDGIYYQFTKRVPRPQSGEEALAMGLGPRQIDPADRLHQEPDSVEIAMVKAAFVGSNSAVEVIALDEMEYKCNYFIGNDPSKWATDVPNYHGITLKDLYPGVDASFESREGQLELRLTAASNEDLARVKTEYYGADALSRVTDDIVSLRTPLGEKRFAGILPVEESVPATTNTTPLHSSSTDVSLVYSTYLGGSDFDHVFGIALDGLGQAYLTGSTYSANFPTLNPYQTDQVVVDVFVAKLSASGSSLVYSTYLGGSDFEEGLGIALDGLGQAYLTGYTYSANFPTLNPYQTDQVDKDAFVAKLSASGSSLVYSTYLGGSDIEEGHGIALDGLGQAYLTGYTLSNDFPTLNPYQTDQGTYDVFVTKLSASGSSLVYSTYLGGGESDLGFGIALDGSGQAYLTGNTYSANFPTLNPYQSDQDGTGSDVFATKLSATGSSLVYSTYLGGSDTDLGYGIALDAAGQAYVTGYTQSTNFPTLNPFQTDQDGTPSDVFVTKLSAFGGAPLPQLLIEPISLQFESISGGTQPDPQTVSITNTGGGTLSWQASEDLSWLNVTPSSGVSNSSQTVVSIVTTELVPDIYSGVITISSSNAVNSPQVISVDYRVDPAPFLELEIYDGDLHSGLWSFQGIPLDIGGVKVRSSTTGQYLTGSSGVAVSVTFTNGELPINMTDIDDDGVFTGTWIPQTLGPVIVNIGAQLAGFAVDNESYTGAVYEPVSSTSLQNVVQEFSEAVNIYLSSNSWLVHEIMRTGIDSIRATVPGASEQSLAILEKVGLGAISALPDIINKQVPSNALAQLGAKLGFEGLEIVRSGQVTKMVSALRGPAGVEYSDYLNTYKIGTSGATVQQAKDQILRGIRVPNWVPKGYPVGVITNRVEALTTAVRRSQAMQTDVDYLKKKQDDRIFWRMAGNCGGAYRLYTIGTEVKGARGFYDNLEKLSSNRDIHGTIMGACRIASWGLAIGNIAGMISGVGAPFSAVLTGSIGGTCTLTDFYFAELQFKETFKLYNYLSTYAASWPSQLGAAYELHTAVANDLSSSFNGDPVPDCAVLWRANNLQFEPFVNNDRIELSGTIQVTNTDDKPGYASLVAEIAAAKEPWDLQILGLSEVGTQHFAPGQSKTFPITIDGIPRDFSRSFSKYVLTVRVLTSGRPHEDFRYTLDGKTFIPQSAIAKTSSVLNTSRDTTWNLYSGEVAPLEVREVIYAPSPGTVQGTLSLLWPFDSLELHVFDASGRHVGLNEVTGQYESQIPGAVVPIRVPGMQYVELTDLAVGPFTTRVVSCGQDTVGVQLAVFEEQVHPAIMTITADTLWLAGVRGDTSWLGVSVNELGEQEPVTNITASLSNLTNGTSTIFTDTVPLGSFPTDVAPGSTLELFAPIAIPADLDSGRYEGTVHIQADQGSFTIPVYLEVKLPYLRGDWDNTGAIDISDLQMNVDFLFFGGGSAYPGYVGDANCDNGVDIGDLQAIIDYLFFGGASPACL